MKHVAEKKLIKMTVEVDKFYYKQLVTEEHKNSNW